MLIVYEISDAIWRRKLTTRIIFTHLSMHKEQCLFLRNSRALGHFLSCCALITIYKVLQTWALSVN